MITFQFRDFESGHWVPLHFAAKNNSKEIGEVLISKGAHLNAKTFQDQPNWASGRGNLTPLHIAAENNSKEIGELLISKGADINAIGIIYPKIKLFFLFRRI